MLNINHLSYSYAKRLILDDLSLSLKEGEFFALAGLNGAGKTTLIKLILDLLRSASPDKIRINSVSSWSVKSRVEIAYLSERFTLNAQTSAWDFFELLSGVYRQPLNRNNIIELCDKLEFPANFLKKKSYNYSKGMLQKVGLIGCLMLDARLMILDEPFSGLDPQARFLVKDMLLEEKKKLTRSLLYSTHMLTDIEVLSDVFAVLHKGKLQFVGDPKDCISLFQAASLEQAFLACVEKA